MKFVFLILSLFFTSCASYVDNIHRQLDNETRPKAQAYRVRRPYPRQQSLGAQRGYNTPVTLGSPTTANNSNYYPGTQRDYQNNRRTRSEDLKDNGSDGSLWSGDQKENFLFVTNNLKNQGDIVIVEVLSDFKDEITNELKRAYPVVESKKDDKKKAESKEEVKTQVADKDTKKEEEVYDKISTQVIERLNGDYLLIKGRKEVVFNKGRRFVEIQGLISQKSISDTDTVLSDKILEPKIRVLRY